MAVATTLPAPFRWQGEHVAAQLPGARALFTTRRGGVSSGPYASLNLGRLTADDPAAVAENHARLGAATGCAPEHVLYGRQVHGPVVRRVTEAPAPGRPVSEEDGQATALAGHGALVFVADCLPVLLAAGGAVAAVHAGWRGLAGGVIAAGVAALRDVGGRGAVTALIGPGARSCCYETGEDVHAAFAGDGARVGERRLDLALIARRRLEAAGAAAVHDVGLCTICHPQLFFSHRRDDGVTGRQAGLAWRI
jgi:YfiH family protein